MKVSFLIPTRGRLQSLLGGIESIKKTASPDVQIEILIRVDDNDTETLAGRSQIPSDVIVVVGPRWLGYDSGCLFFNELAAKSTGDWIIPWNDDIFMKTKHWDKLLPPFDNINIVWLHITGSWTWAHPIMTRKLYKLWGCFSPYSPCDACIFTIWRTAGKPLQESKDFKITVEHHRNEADIIKRAIRPQDKVAPPRDPAIKTAGELAELLRNAK